MGLYDISRHLERGETPRPGASGVPWSSTLGNVGVFAVVPAVTLVMPLLGHADWHAYRDLVKPDQNTMSSRALSAPISECPDFYV